MLDIILACAPNVAPSTIQEIIRVESKGNPLAININTRNGVRLKPTIKIKTAKHAIAVTHAAIERGHTVDMGYMQINSVNLKGLGYTVADMFNPCKNITAGAEILTRAYISALPKHQNEQSALKAALSIYNTGNPVGGFRNGYVEKFYSPKVTQK